ncbi:MAG: hypothetical protein R6X20_07945 [Phycisphaerae bacterium]
MTLRRLLVLTALAAAVAVANGPARAAGPPQEIELRLFDALFRGETPDEDPASFILLLGREDDTWRRVYGVARDFAEDVHAGRVTEGRLTDEALTLSLAMTVLRGRLRLPAAFEVDLERAGDGLYRGRYTGTFRGADVRGEATAEVLPSHRRPPADFEPVAPGEHPRLLFRRSDLDALRRKAETPFGKAALAGMDGPVGLAVRYQLTGEEDLARQIIPLVEKMMDRGLLSDQFGHNVGDRLEQTAVAYDCCRDAWPADVRRRVEEYMLWAGNRILAADRTAHQAINWHVCSNWSAPLYAGAGFAGLALFGEKGPKPPEPLPTRSGARIDPAQGYEPSRGVPVSDFASGEMPPEWIYVGGFRLKDDADDPLASVGGRAKARLEPGQTITYRGQTETVKPLSHETDKGYWQNENYAGGKPLIDVTNAVDRRFFTHNYFYTVIRNEAPRRVRVATDPGDGTVYLNGVRLEPGEAAHLAKGLYPLLVEAPIGWMNPWGRHLMRPRLVEVAEDEAEAATARAKARHAARVEAWQADVARWEASGGANVACADLLGRSRFMMYMFCREAVGTGGYSAELTHYGGIAEKPPARYAAAHRTVFGYGVSPKHEMADLLPRKMFCHVYPPGGEPVAQEINSTPQAPPELFAALFPVVRRTHRPAVLWGWRRHAGIAGDGPPTAVLAGDPVRAFLHYPLEGKAKPPAGILPLTWQAPTFGFYGFRNAWAGDDDFITQAFLKAHPIGGWNAPNAGTFRVRGLGHVWADGPTDRNRHRWEESVVMLPENPEINVSACARLTHIKTFDDGSGIVAMNLDDVYASRKKDHRGKGMRLYERYGGIRQDEAFVDTGITGVRSIGVDYSGASGAPCLLAVADRIRGGGRKVWVWQLHAPGKKGKKAKGDAGAVDRTRTDGSRFTLTQPGGATLAGTFVTGQRPVAEVRRTTMKGRAGSSAGKTLKRPIHGVFAEDDDGDFLVIVTIQRNEPPEVRVQGKGLDATATVGKRVVRFDGETIVFDLAD